MYSNYYRIFYRSKAMYVAFLLNFLIPLGANKIFAMDENTPSSIRAEEIEAAVIKSTIANPTTSEPEISHLNVRTRLNILLNATAEVMAIANSLGSVNRLSKEDVFRKKELFKNKLLLAERQLAVCIRMLKEKADEPQGRPDQIDVLSLFENQEDRR